MSALSASVSITRSPSGASSASIRALCAIRGADVTVQAICSAFFITRSFFRVWAGADGDGLQTPKVQRIAAGRHAGDVVKRVVLILKVMDDFTLQIDCHHKTGGFCCGLKPRRVG